MASRFVRNLAAFLAEVWPIIGFYAALGLIVTFGVLSSGCAATAPVAPVAQPFMPNGSDTVPNKVSCQFRGESFCHKKEYHV